jgi:hypothetical protein
VRKALIVLLLALALVPAATADGDPASDTLLVQNVFFPYPRPPSTTANALSREVAIAYGRGYRLKVAVVATESDLGAVPSLFNKPQDYAKFLGQELTTYYVGPLLIVMPAGYGIYDGGRSTLKERKVLATADAPGSTGEELTTSAAMLVRELVARKALVSKDIKVPYVAALSATVKPGTSASLAYAVFDDSGRTRERMAVRDAKSHVLASWGTKMRMTSPTKTYTVSWKVPKSVPTSGLKFCLTAYDTTGNRSANSCAPVVVKS